MRAFQAVWVQVAFQPDGADTIIKQSSNRETNPEVPT
jgi:hypothetical protein